MSRLDMDLVDVFKRRTRSPKRPRSGDIINTIFPHFRQHPPYEGSLILGEADQWEKAQAMERIALAKLTELPANDEARRALEPVLRANLEKIDRREKIRE